MQAMVCRKPIQKDTKQLVDSARTQLYSSASLKPQGSGPVERGSAWADRACEQPGQPVAAVGVSGRGRPLAAHQPAVTASENGGRLIKYSRS
jgi:hypothetical protein